MRMRTERGLANLVIIAVALPVLILMITAATDISRVILAKSQLYHALNTGYDYLLMNVGADGLQARNLNGRNWCALARSENRTINDTACLATTCEYTDPSTCTAATFTPGGPFGSTSLELARNAIIEDLKGSGLFGFTCSAYTSGPPPAIDSGTVANCEIALKVGLYYLVARGMSVDGANSRELLKAVTLGTEAELDGLGQYVTTRPVNLAGMVTAKFIDAGTPKTMGIEYGANAATHVPLIAIWGAVKVKHAFPFPDWLDLGDPLAGGTYSTSETIVSGVIMRPLGTPVWLSNSTSTSVSTTTSTSMTTTAGSTTTSTLGGAET